MDNTRDPNREFSAEVRKDERIAAGNACRICGKSKDLEWLQHAHIYTLSFHPKWERTGSDARKWHNDYYVSSYDNCLALCKTHHGKIDSELGLQKITVQYLESLKTDSTSCTALIGPINGEWRRCKKKNGRGNPKAKGNGYRCALHLEGGNEERLVARSGGWIAKETAPKHKSTKKTTTEHIAKSKPKKKSKGCVVM